MQKKKILTATLASTLAATVIAGAGTFAYLQANTGTITNKFGKNAEEGLDITLTETGVTLDNEGNGEKIYEIKPDQQDDKDPTVTVTNNIDVFTFVEISDKTTLDNNKIVNYLVDEGWTKMTDELADYELVNDEVTDVYYRIVAADADNKEFPVIKDNEITYARNITGDKIDNDDVTIAFQAFCIDKAPFVEDGKDEIVSAADAYKAIPRVLAYEPEGNFTTVAVSEDTVAVSAYIGTNTVVNIPRTINGKTVVEIENNAFANNTTVTKVTVPSTVTFINVAAFQSTPNLKEVRLSKNLTELSDKAFSNSGYLEEYTLRRDLAGLTPITEKRSDQTDEEFVNFREVATTGIRPDTLYRSSSPINDRLGRSSIADECIKKHGIDHIINLYDSEETAKAYPGYQGSYASTIDAVYLTMSPDYTSERFRTTMAKVVTYIAEHPGKYVVHCVLGEHRTGAVCMLLSALMGASYEELVKDYMQTYVNLYDVKPGTKQYELLVDDNVNSILKSLFRVDDPENADLSDLAADYIRSAGVSDETLRQVRKNPGI